MKKYGFFLFYLLLTACARDINSDSYQMSSVGSADQVGQGVIVDVRTVTIQGLTQKELSEQKALQYIVRLADGNMITVIQGMNNRLAVGQRVFILYGQETHLIPDTLPAP